MDASITKNSTRILPAVGRNVRISQRSAVAQRRSVISQYQCSRKSFISTSNRTVALRTRAVKDEDLLNTVNAVRFLSIDGVNKAKSGHPGMPMGCAPIGSILFGETMLFNPENPQWFNRDRYCIMGDGCHMEGISNEAASLAGHWGLGKLICLYDDNHISIDGNTNIAFTEDVCARYRALGWHVLHVEDGNTDFGSIRRAIEEAKSVTDKPTLIKVTTTIGFGSPNKAGTHSVHGSPLGKDETEAARKFLNWSHGEFEVPSSAYDYFKKNAARGKDAESQWSAALKKYASTYPQEFAELRSIMTGELPPNWDKSLPSPTTADKAKATRLHSQDNLNAVSNVVPGFLGGSADLAPSNMTLMSAYKDYMRASIRLAALSHAGVIFVMTHDSIGLGEDGPTHQPVEHLESFRIMPNILMMRPGDGLETAACYKIAVENALGVGVPGGKPRPTVMALSRQNVNNLEGSSAEGVSKGGYVVFGGKDKPDLILMGTGTELGLAVDAAKDLTKEGLKVRVVSFPSLELFEEQSQVYKDSVLPPDVKARVSVEAGVTSGWLRYVGFEGKSVGLDHFGASGPAGDLYKEFGITKENVIATAKSLL